MSKSRLVFVASVMLVSLGAMASVKASPALHTNYMTFSAPVALPGVALPAGTYVFEVPIAGAFDVVRVMSRDGRQVYLTAFTRTVSRPAARTLTPQVLFNEVPRGVTPPVKVWYPAGETTGHEFIYPTNSPQLGRDTE
jgi:hypothetical protein